MRAIGIARKWGAHTWGFYCTFVQPKKKIAQKCFEFSKTHTKTDWGLKTYTKIDWSLKTYTKIDWGLKTYAKIDWDLKTYAKIDCGLKTYEKN